MHVDQITFTLVSGVDWDEVNGNNTVGKFIAIMNILSLARGVSLRGILPNLVAHVVRLSNPRFARDLRVCRLTTDDDVTTQYG